jgi:hypothetical protein
VDITPSCWSKGCHLENNLNVKKKCKNEMATKWNLIAVEYMERYLESGGKEGGEGGGEGGRGGGVNGDVEMAIEKFEKAVEIDPECESVHMNLAMVYLLKTKYQSSIYHASKAIELMPNNARFYAIRSFIYEMVGQEIDRETDMHMALSLDPFIGERKYFGILLCNVTDTSRYTRFPMIVQYNAYPEQIAALKFLLWIEFAKTSISDYAILPPGTTDFFVDNKYIVVQKIMPQYILSEIQNCYRSGVLSGRINYVDDQALRYVAQNDRCGRLLLFNVVDLVRRVIAHNARPTYVYFGSYFNGSVLRPHSDRPQCEFTFSVTLQQNPPDKPWSLGMRRVPQFEKNDNFVGADGEPWPDEKDEILADLYEGDGLLFMGRHLIHYRKGIFMGEDRWLDQVFLHFVQEDFTGLLD